MPANSVALDGPAATGGQLIIRTLDILRALNRRSFVTLQGLWEDTGLPKPTIHRILGTLCEQGYVARDPVRGVYRLTARVQLLSAGYSERSRITDVGAGILRAVTQDIRWPLALGTLERTEVVVRYSTMPFSPWAVKATTVNNRHRLLGTAMGTAYLAACTAEERDTLLDMVRQGDDPVAMLARDTAHVASVVARTRQRGFGLREAGPNGDSTSIAVPITASGQVAGVVSLTMFRRSLTEQALRRYPPILRDVSRRIAAQLEDAAGASVPHSPVPPHGMPVRDVGLGVPEPLGSPQRKPTGGHEMLGHYVDPGVVVRGG